MKMGIIGFVPFLWMSFTFLKRGFLNWSKIDDRFLKCIVIGFTLSYLGLMISNVVAPKFMEWPGIIIIGIILGMNEAIYRVDKKNSEDIPIRDRGENNDTCF